MLRCSQAISKMSLPKYADFLTKLKIMDVPPIIGVYGSDRYLRKNLVDEITKKLGKGKKVEKEIFYANDTSVEEILAVSQTYSMFASLKTILIYQFQSFNPAQRNQLLSYLDNPNPNSVLILFADPPQDYSEEKKFKDWFIRASKKIEMVDVANFSETEAESLIKELAKTFGKRITAEAVDLLLNSIGPEPEMIYLALEKISLYLGDAKLITSELVSELVIGSRLQNIFELAESLGKKDLAQSLEKYRKMLSQKQPREMILSIIKRHYRILLQLQASLGSEQMSREVLDRFRIPRNFHQQYKSQAERYTESDLKKAFAEFYDTERLIKSSALDEEAVMERLILRLCRI